MPRMPIRNRDGGGGSAIERRLRSLEERADAAADNSAEALYLLRQIARALNVSIQMEIAMNKDLQQDLDNLKNEITETRGSVDSAKALIGRMSQKLNDLASSQADAPAMRKQIQEYASALNSMQDDLAQAVAANDPDAQGGGNQGGGQGGGNQGGGGSGGGVDQGGSGGGVGAGTSGSGGGAGQNTP